MKKSFVWLFAVVCCLALSSEEPFRIWTDNKGQTMEARLISIADDKIEIIRKDGVSFTVSPNIFSERDRNYIAKASRFSSATHRTETGLILHYKFDEKNGMKAIDSSGNNHHGTLRNMGDPSWVNGKLGGALSFDGINDHVLVADHDSLDLGNTNDREMSISLWFYNFGRNGTLLAKSKAAMSDNIDYTILIEHSPKIGIVWGTGPSAKHRGDNINAWTFTGVVPHSRKWNHLVATYGEGSKKLYLNDSLVKKVKVGRKNSSNAGSLKLGCQFNGHYWKGHMDDLRIFDHVLRPDQIRALSDIVDSRSDTTSGVAPDSDDPQDLKEILAEAIEKDRLLVTKETDPDVLYRNRDGSNYSGWVKASYRNALAELSGGHRIKHLEKVANGKREGLTIDFYANAQEAMRSHWKNGHMDGPFEQWYLDGEKEREGFFRNGKMDGRFVEYHKNGRKRSEGQWKNGKMDGVWIFYNEDGATAERISYENGEKVGTTNDGRLIKDPALEASIRERLKKPTGAISRKDLDSMYFYLKCKSASRITDLSGLEYATNLEDLVITVHQITDVSPLSRLTKLRHLDLMIGRITDVSPLTKLANLERLNLTGNPITDVSPLTKLTKLESLRVNAKPIGLPLIDVTPLTKMTNLKSLYFGYENQNRKFPADKKAMLRKALPNCDIKF
jgi:antitoxin component YwqK of YwqJK toxin-antitoxin module